MRAHVEVDKTVHMSCLDTGLKLKDEFRAICDVQICGKLVVLMVVKLWAS